MKSRSALRAHRKGAFDRARSGWTLIETMLLVSLTVTFGVVGIKTLMLLMEIDGRLAESAMLELTTERFEDVLRNDVESSLAVTMTDAGFNLAMSDGETIEYRFAGETIQRTIPRLRNPSHDRFSFPESIIALDVNQPLIEVIIRRADIVPDRERTLLLDAGHLLPIHVRARIGRRVWHQARPLEDQT